MKILVVAHDSNFSGGANRSLYMVLKKLKFEYGVDIEVLLPKKSGDLNKKLDEINITWFSYPYFGVISGIRGDGKDFLRYGKVYIGYFIEHILSLFLKRKLKDKEYNLIYTNTRLPIVGAKIAKYLDVPHVCHVREFGTTKPLWGFWDYKKIYDLSDKIILISNALHKKFNEFVPEDKLITIHNGVDSPLGLSKVDKKDKSNFDILLTGRLVPDKGHMDALRALKELVNLGYTDIRLFIAGSSPQRTHISWYAAELKSYVKEFSLEKNVVFLGEVEDMITIRSQMDIELMCSICETFGRVTVEAMRSHLPVIGSNTGGTPEIIINGHTGLLYEQGNSDDLKDKILLLYKNRNLLNSIGKRGYEYVQTHFTAEKNVQEIYRILNNCYKRSNDGKR